MTRILAGAVCGHGPDVVRPYVRTLTRTAEQADADVDFVFLTDPKLAWDAADVLPGEVAEADPKPEDADYAVQEQSHVWTEETFNWLGAQKQKLCDRAADEGYDYLFLADTDLLLGPQTLPSLLNVGRPITSAVFWTRWQPDARPLPNVWLTQPYEFQGRGYEPHEFLRRLQDRRLTRVWGLGACTLIDVDVLDRVAYDPPLPGLPKGGMWRGEDRSFCIRAEQSHIQMWADPWPDVYHLYRPSQAREIPGVLDELSRRTKLSPPELDDLVSFTVEPLEEPGLANYVEHVRGTLGRLDMLPDIRNKMCEMTPGEERLTRIRFPDYYPEMSAPTPEGTRDLAPDYRGTDKLVRLRLLGVKPEEEPFQP